MDVGHHESQFELFLFVIRICEKTEDVSTSRIWTEDTMPWAIDCSMRNGQKGRRKKEREMCCLHSGIFSDWTDMILFPMILDTSILLSTIHYWDVHTWLSISRRPSKTNNCDFPIKESQSHLISDLLLFNLGSLVCSFWFQRLSPTKTPLPPKKQHNSFGVLDYWTDSWQKIICHLKCNTGHRH